MPAPFVFRKVLYLVEAIGLRAANLDDLLRGVNVVDGRAIAYHMHHGFLDLKFIESEYPNDFARWVARALGDQVLAEKLANLRVFPHRSPETLRAELARLIAEHLLSTEGAAAQRSPRGLEFFFQAAASVVMDCQRVAGDLEELVAALASVPSSSIYYHLFETRFTAGGNDNDFSEWIATSVGDAALAARIAELDPYMVSIEEARRRLVGLVNDHLLAQRHQPGARR